MPDVETSAAPAEEAIHAVNRRFMDAYARRDAAGMASLYTEDAYLLAAGAPMMRGPQEIQRALQGMMDAGVERIDLRPETVTMTGDDTAYEIGTAAITIRPPGGEAFDDPGKYMVVWKRVGGEWKLHADIFNSDTPPPQ
jgi:uncharacterized protein (TIGR02246 family)